MHNKKHGTKRTWDKQYISNRKRHLVIKNVTTQKGNRFFQYDIIEPKLHDDNIMAWEIIFIYFRLQFRENCEAICSHRNLPVAAEPFCCSFCMHIRPLLPLQPHNSSKTVTFHWNAEGETPYMCLSTGLKQSRTQSGFARWSRQRLHDSKGIALGFTDWLKNQHIFVVTVLQFNHAQRIKQRLHSFLFN